MSENSTASEWTAARGEKWRAKFACMEAMLTPVDDPLIRALNLDAPFRIATGQEGAKQHAAAGHREAERGLRTVCAAVSL